MKIVWCRDRITAIAAFFVCVVLAACSGSHGMAPPTGTTQSGATGRHLHAAALTNEEWVLPSFAYTSSNGSGCGGGSQGLDAGTASAYVFWGEEDCGSKSASLLSDCPGKSSSGCQLYVYGDLTKNQCAAGYEANFVSWANSNDEDAFFHTFNNPRSAGYRMQESESYSTSCGSYGGSNTATFYMNITDPSALSWLETNYWKNTTYVPTGYGQLEDDFGPGAGGGSCTASGSLCSTEYGEPGQWTSTGTGTHNVTQSNAQGYATWLNSTGIPMVVNGYPGHKCSTASGGHCYGDFADGNADTEDNGLRLAEFCSDLTATNFYGFVSERAIYTGYAFQPPYRQTSIINTASNFLANHSSDNCKNVRLIDLEQPGAPSPSSVRSYQAALRWMVPSGDGTPDFVIPWRYNYGQTASEVALFPDDTVVPSGPESTFSAYHFNGATLTDGTGCAAAGSGPSADGDTGGAISEVVDCPSAGQPVLLVQYHHCYYGQSGTQVDEGPCAALLNTSTTAVTIQSSWFKGDALSTYKHTIDFNGYEWPHSTPLYYASGQSTTIPCMNSTYCNGSVDFTGTIPSSIPAQSGLFLIGIAGPKLVQSAVKSPDVFNATITETLSSAPAVGDVMTLCVGSSNAITTWTGPSGWTLAASSTRSACYDRVVHSGDGTSYTVTVNTNSDLVGEIAEWSGVNTTTPVDKASDVLHASGSSSYASGSVTPTVTGDVPVGWVSQAAQPASTLSSSGNTADPAGQINNTDGYGEGEMFYGAPLTSLSSYSMSASSTSTAAGAFGLFLLEPQ